MSSAYPSIAVGPVSLVVSTHPRTLIYSKAGALIASLSTQEMFETPLPVNRGRGTTDMRVLFDQRSGRFFYVGAMQGPCAPGECTVGWVIAVSKTSEPTSLTPRDWYFYSFDGSLENGVPSGQKGDFNVVGLTDDKLVLVGISIPPTGQAYGKVWVFDSAPFFTGAPVDGPTQSYARLRDPVFGRMFEQVYPAVTFGRTDTAFVVTWITGNCSIGVIGITGPPASAAMKVHTARARGDCGGPTEAPQLGGGAPLDAMPQITAAPVYRDGHLWLVQSILHSTPAGPVGALRLVELDVSRWPEAPTYVTDATYFEDDVWYFNPALTVDPQHNVAIVANRSSPREYGSVWITGRRADDPPASFRPPVALKTGEANWNWVVTSHSLPIRQRNLFSMWSAAATDPVDHMAWLIGQSARTACEWEVWVGRTDYTVADTASGSLIPPTVTPVRSEPCQRGGATTTGGGGAGQTPGPLTLAFLEQLPVGSVSGPPGAIPIAFGVGPGGLGPLTPAQAGAIVVGTFRDWTTTPRHAFVLLVPGSTPAGEYELVLRLPDGREARTRYNLVRP